MITAVAFDLGGVLTPPPLAGMEDYTAALGLPAGTLISYFRNNPGFAAVETGEAVLADHLTMMTVEVRQRHGVDIEPDAMLDAVRPGFRIVPEMLALLEELAPNYRLALLTNNVRESESWWHQELPPNLFDVLMDSSDIGLRKPDFRVYAELLFKLKKPAEQVVLVDDFEENLPNAADMGIHPVHFVDPVQCRARLRELGLDLAP